MYSVSNNFYDKSETYLLPLSKVYAGGEIANPGYVDFSSLVKRSVIVKEALPDDEGGNRFTGAFRYDGYSLFDILEKRILKKANEAEYSSVIDLFIEVENNEGDMAVFTWGDIYYPSDLHRIILADSVTRIIPTKTLDMWVLPLKNKVIASGDLLTVRNISDPVKITVRSIKRSFEFRKGLTPLYSEKILLYENSELKDEIFSLPESLNEITYNTIFYGRGRGIHSTTPFTGIMLKEVLRKHFPVTEEKLKKGILCITGADGYRCSVSFSELFNRNDRQEFLIIPLGTGSDGGVFRIFPAADFFSDRAVKSVKSIHLDF